MPSPQMLTQVLLVTEKPAMQVEQLMPYPPTVQVLQLVILEQLAEQA